MKETKKSKFNIDQLDELLVFKYLENSYKIFWIKGIINELEKGQKEISFLDIALNMVIEAWELVVDKGITFGRHDKMHRVIEELKETWQIDNEISKEELLEILRYLPDIHETVEALYEDAPYRLFEPIYERKLKGKKDSAKNQILKDVVNEDGMLLYKITDEKTIVLNTNWMKYIKGNKRLVEGWLHDKLCYFLDERAMKH